MANNTIGPKIKEFRKSQKLTQEQLASALGYSGKSVISHIEKGDADMTYEKILLMLRKFSLDANSLFDGEIKERKTKKDVKEEPAKNVKRLAVYIHGVNGSAKEADNYAYLEDNFNVVGLDYQDGNPWEVGPIVKDKFAELIKGYDEVVVIANSIGAFYTYEYLSEFNVKRAFFISPIVSMLQSIIDLMEKYGIKDKELREKKLMTLEDGTVLSYDFYQHVSDAEDTWEVPTDVLYGAYDEVVYFGGMLEFLENHPNCKLTVKSNAQHYFQSEEELEFIKDWILKNIA